MKKSILALTFLGTCLVQAMEAEKLQEKFNFADLPGDVQNLIVEQAWADIDTIENMRMLVSSVFDDANLKTETSVLENYKYGYHGFKVPISFYTLHNGQPCISTIGTILDYAQSLDWPILESHVSSTELFIDRPKDTLLSITLKDGNNPSAAVQIKSACFSVLGKLAIIWKSGNNERFLTVFNLKDIRDKKELDLYQNAIKFDKPLGNDDNLIKGLTSPTGPLMEITGSVFSLDGSKLFTHFKDILGCEDHVTFDDIRDIANDQPLTTAEKAKRLGIATVGAKALIDLRKTK